MSDTLKVTDPFEVDFGTLSKANKERVIVVLRVFMSEIRVILDGTRKLTNLLRPECEICETCAFEPKTDVLEGFPGTSYGLLKTILKQNNFFGCHSGHPWKEGKINRDNVSVCAGFERVNLFSAHQTVLCALETQKAIDFIVKEVGSRKS